MSWGDLVGSVVLTGVVLLAVRWVIGWRSAWRHDQWLTDRALADVERRRQRLQQAAKTPMPKG